MTFARVILVCFLISTCLLKHTLSWPSAPRDEDDAFNEVDFEEEVPGKDYDNVEDDPDFNPEDYYGEEYDEYDEEYDDEGKEAEAGEEDDDDDDEGKGDEEGEEKEEEEEEEEDDDDDDDDDDDGDEEDQKSKNRIKRYLDGINNSDEEFDAEEEELRAMELEEDQIPVGKDIVENPSGFENDEKSDDFDEEKDIFVDALEPDNEDEVQQNEDDDESDGKEDFPIGSGETPQDDEDDDVDEMDSEETYDDESRMKTDIPPDGHHIEQGVDKEEDASYYRKFKAFMRNIAGFLNLVDKDKKET